MFFGQSQETWDASVLVRITVGATYAFLACAHLLHTECFMACFYTEQRNDSTFRPNVTQRQSKLSAPNGTQAGTAGSGAPRAGDCRETWRVCGEKVTGER